MWPESSSLNSKHCKFGDKIYTIPAISNFSYGIRPILFIGAPCVHWLRRSEFSSSLPSWHMPIKYCTDSHLGVSPYCAKCSQMYARPHCLIHGTRWFHLTCYSNSCRTRDQCSSVATQLISAAARSTHCCPVFRFNWSSSRLESSRFYLPHLPALLTSVEHNNIITISRLLREHISPPNASIIQLYDIAGGSSSRIRMVIRIVAKIEFMGPMAKPYTLQEISSKSVHNFFSYPTDRQTYKQTEVKT